MKFNDSYGFSMIECLLAFVLFSLMMCLYVPAYTEQLFLLDKVEQEVFEWHLFERLIYLTNEDPQLIDLAIQNYNNRTDHRVMNYSSNSGRFLLEMENHTLMIECYDVS